MSNDDLDTVYNSRSFSLFEDVEKIRQMGLGKGGSLENAVVVGDDKILNDEGLKTPKGHKFEINNVMSTYKKGKVREER